MSPADRDRCIRRATNSLLVAALSGDPWQVADAINGFFADVEATNWKCDVDGPDHSLTLWLVCTDGYEQRLSFDDCVAVGVEMLRRVECWPKEAIEKVMNKEAA